MIGSALCGMAQTMEQLIAFRLIQGIGAGAILPVTQTIIADMYPSEEIVFLGLAVVCVLATLLLPRSKQNAAKESA